MSRKAEFLISEEIAPVGWLAVSRKVGSPKPADIFRITDLFLHLRSLIKNFGERGYFGKNSLLKYALEIQRDRHTRIGTHYQYVFW